jgi:hypothetical protein
LLGQSARPSVFARPSVPMFGEHAEKSTTMRPLLKVCTAVH